MERLSKFELKVRLRQHSPMVHFQSEMNGATVRATELKPKLDKFLIHRIWGSKEKVPKHFFTGREYADRAGLDYRIKIVAEGIGAKGKVRIISQPDHDTIRHESILVSITSANSEMLDHVEKEFPFFVACTNFGRRQNKGWGSFAIDQYSVRQFEQDLLSLELPVFKYSEKLNAQDPFKLDESIEKNIWAKLKSGYNFRGEYEKSRVFEYFASMGYRWEKRKIKQEINKLIRKDRSLPKLKTDPDKGLAPVDIDEHGTIYNDWGDHQENDYRFTRIYLGLPEYYEFSTNEGKKYHVKISHPDIKRYKAPVTFKLFDGHVYALVEEIPDEIRNGANTKFTFQIGIKGGSNDLGHFTLNLIDGFNLTDFLDNHLVQMGFTRLTK